MLAACPVQATSRRRPSSAASRSARSRLRSAHRPDARSARSARTARCSTCGPTLAHTDIPRRTRSSRYASRPAPVGLVEAVGAVPRNGHRLDPGPDRAGQLGQRRPPGDQVGGLGQVVTGQPEPGKPSGVGVVVREHHHPASHPPHFAQPGDRVRPVVNGAERHRGVEGLVRERKASRAGRHARRRARGTVRAHDRRRFHRDDVQAGRLVGAGAGPDIQAPSARRRARPRPGPRSAARSAGSPGTCRRWCRTTARRTCRRLPGCHPDSDGQLSDRYIEPIYRTIDGITSPRKGRRWPARASTRGVAM